MKIIISDNYEASSIRAADDLVALACKIKEPLVCTASGDSPAGIYREIVQKAKKGQLDTSNWFFVGLDEWAGMNGSDEGSCRYHLDRQLFQQLTLKKDQLQFFDGRASLDEECRRTEAFIQQHGGIDIAILGLGLNGHIGMNEPGTPKELRSHITDIDPLTAQTGQKYFKEPRDLSKGVSLGMGTILEAKHIMLIINGAHKAGIVKKMLEEKISEEIPATLLRNHPGLFIYLDKDAASLIS